VQSWHGSRLVKNIFGVMKKWNAPCTSLSFMNPEPAAHNFSALTATPQMVVAKLWQSLILMQRA